MKKNPYELAFYISAMHWWCLQNPVSQNTGMLGALRICFFTENICFSGWSAASKFLQKIWKILCSLQLGNNLIPGSRLWELADYHIQFWTCTQCYSQLYPHLQAIRWGIRQSLNSRRPWNCTVHWLVSV